MADWNDDDDDDDDDDDFSVVLDADGRVYGSTLGEESYATTAWEGCFDGGAAEDSDAFYDALKAECASVRNGQHWFGACDAPRCALERFAMRVFDFHAPDEEDGYDAETSGVEFWTQDGASLGAHFDKDETAREKVGVIVTPHLATVTYLSDGGAPTVVFEGLTPRSLPEEKRANESCERVAVMYPKVGAHLRFDGRFLHGVLSEFADDTPTEGKRMTLLCNVWLNHKPMGVERLPEEVSTALNAGASMEHVWKTSKLKSREIGASGDDDYNEECVPMRANKFGPTGGEYVIHAKLPFAQIKRAAKDSNGGVLFVRCEPFSIEAGIENEDGPDVKRAKTS